MAPEPTRAATFDAARAILIATKCENGTFHFIEHNDAKPIGVRLAIPPGLLDLKHTEQLDTVSRPVTDLLNGFFVRMLIFGSSLFNNGSRAICFDILRPL